MRKHVFTVALASLLAIAALAVPTMASASPVLEYEWGEEVPVGEAFNQNALEFQLYSLNSGVAITCFQGELNGAVAANSGSEIVGEIAEGSFGECHTYYGGYLTVEFEEMTGMPWCYSSTTLGSAVLKSCKSNTFGFRLSMREPGAPKALLHCVYGAEKLGAAYNIGSAPLVSSLPSSGTLIRQSGSQVGCPAKFQTQQVEFEVTAAGNPLMIN